MKPLLLTTLALFLVHLTRSQDELPNVASGEIQRVTNFESEFITPRNVDVWLPAGYTEAKQYAVLYMHDGQMLFDPEQTWNHQAWDIDDIATKLLEEEMIRPFIVVGVWNGGTTRHADYFPQEPFDELSPFQKDTVTAQLKRSHVPVEGSFKPQSDKYLKFMVEELKPYIDRNYSVYTDKEHTFVMGSSMGGLISMYALCKYPHIFGGAACLSTHWPGTFTLDNNPIPHAFLQFLEAHLPPPDEHKLYFDCGNETLDSLYPQIQAQVDQLMEGQGYGDRAWRTHFFPGENHSEDAWSKRLHVPLTFLLEY